MYTKNIKGFTLIEIVLVVVISGSIFTVLYGITSTLPKIKNFNDARQNLIQQTTDSMDKFAILFQDYTIDYEEYFNRKLVGCSKDKKGKNFEWTVSESGYCNAFTAYGNENDKLLGDEGKFHHIRYCSSDPKDNTNHTIPLTNCKDGELPVGNNAGRLSYGQYKQLFRDVKNDTDGKQQGIKPEEVGDSDDLDIGNGPQAIGDPKHIQELYLISHDGTKRLFLRRKLKTYTDHGKLFTGYTLQMLKLRGFDAGKKHHFDAENDRDVYDGQLDTRACDYGQHFLCKGTPIQETLYSGYKLPADQDDGRIDFFDENLNITEWNIEISPVKHPDYARAEEYQQIDPRIKIALTAKLSPHVRANKLGGHVEDFQFSLQNLYTTKGFYLQ